MPRNPGVIDVENYDKNALNSNLRKQDFQVRLPIEVVEI